MAGRLDGKVALITGGGSGIGRATSLLFAREGAAVVVADINFASAEATAARIGDRALAFPLDVTREPDWERAVQAAIDRFGKLDIVGNIAGIGFNGSIEDMPVEEMNALLSVNVLGLALGCKHGIKAIRRSGGAGAIINMSSVMGHFAPSDLPAYATSKGAVTLLTKSVAMHCAERSYPIRCVSIHPTDVDSEMLDPVVAAAGGDRAAVLSRMARTIPMKRLATPRDVANAVLFAASDEASMISGSGIFVDGAQTAGPASAHFE